MLLTGYDLRGIFKKELTFDVIYQATKQFFKKLKIRKAILAVDANRNNFLIKDFLERNFNLEFIGVLPTPIFYYKVIKIKIPGIMITASHLPLKYSGLKFILENGEPWKPYISALPSGHTPEAHSPRSAIVRTSAGMTLRQTRRIINLQKHQIIKEYFKTLFSIIKPKKKIFVCFDKKNFFLNASLPYFEKLKIFHQDNSPIKIKSDLDNDRIFVYLKKRKIHNDLIFYYLALLPQYKKLAVPIFFSQKLRQELIKKGKKIYFIPTGHYYFKKAFKKYNLDLGFEPSGHFYMFKDLKTESPYLALGLFLHLLAELTDLTQTERTKQRIALEEILKLNNSLQLYRFDIKKIQSEENVVSFLKKRYKLKLKKFDGYLLFPKEKTELTKLTQNLNKNTIAELTELTQNLQKNTTSEIAELTQNSQKNSVSSASVQHGSAFYLYLRKSKTENKLRVSFEGDKKILKEIKQWLMKI
ncbi:MAG: phosphomannomutase/phosphoglucomutase [Candidatus Parcubacteria bacterium]|nr:MAG: phosphomannomutase/phosphoglucomutase [Candidatus Parcubacteria bacterium]